MSDGKMLGAVAGSYFGALVARLARFAAGDTTGGALPAAVLDDFDGRGFEDEIYRSVVEDRQAEAQRLGIFYSSCGDLPHWAMVRAGVRCGWLNRKEMSVLVPGHPGWRIGQNISALVVASGLAERVSAADRFEPGDILHAGDTNASAHVDVVLADGEDSDGRFVVSADYGLPAGGIRRSPVRVVGARLVRGHRPLVHVIRARSVHASASAAGLLAGPTFPAGMAANDNGSE